MPKFTDVSTPSFPFLDKFNVEISSDNQSRCLTKQTLFNIKYSEILMKLHFDVAASGAGSEG